MSPTKTTKPIEMLFGLWTKEACIRWGPGSLRGRAILGLLPHLNGLDSVCNKHPQQHRVTDLSTGAAHQGESMASE